MTPTELRERRAQLGLSQPQLAALLDVDPSAVAHWEQERRAIPGFLHLALHALEHDPPPGFHLPSPILRRGAKPGRPRAIN